MDMKHLKTYNESFNNVTVESFFDDLIMLLEDNKYFTIDGLDSLSNIVLYDKENDLPFLYAGLNDKSYLRDYSGLKFRIEEDFIDEEVLSLCKELRYDANRPSLTKLTQKKRNSCASIMKSIEAKILSINYKLFENIGRKLDFKVDSIGLVAPDIPNKTLNIKITWI